MQGKCLTFLLYCISTQCHLDIKPYWSMNMGWFYIFLCVVCLQLFSTVFGSFSNLSFVLLLCSLFPSLLFLSAWLKIELFFLVLFLHYSLQVYRNTINILYIDLISYNLDECIDFFWVNFSDIVFFFSLFYLFLIFKLSETALLYKCSHPILNICRKNI